MLEEGFSSTGVLFQGPGSGQLIPEGPRSSYESWLIFPITFIQCFNVCSWSWSVCYVGGQKLRIRKEGSVVGKMYSDQKSSLDVCRSRCEVETPVDNARYIVNRHRFSWVVCDPCVTCTTDIG